MKAMARLFGLRNVLERNRQYFSQYKVNSVLLLMMIAVNLLLVTIIFKKLSYNATPSYIATTPADDVEWYCPLNNKFASQWQKKYCRTVISPSKVKAFAKQAVLKAWDLDFSNYLSDLTSASKYFTKKAWAIYLSALTKSGNASRLIQVIGPPPPDPKVQSKLLILTPQVENVEFSLNKNGRPKVGLIKNRMNWWVSMRLKIPQLRAVDSVKVRVQREPVSLFPKRLAIAQYVSQ
jgi:hypothetical protein